MQLPQLCDISHAQYLTAIPKHCQNEGGCVFLISGDTDHDKDRGDVGGQVRYYIFIGRSTTFLMLAPNSCTYFF